MPWHKQIHHANKKDKALCTIVHDHRVRKLKLRNQVGRDDGGRRVQVCPGKRI